MPRLQNTVLVTLHRDAGREADPSRDSASPSRASARGVGRLRPARVSGPGRARRLSRGDARCVRSLRSCSALRDHESSFTLHPEVTKDVPYLLEQQRGYASVGDTWSPGYFKLDLAEGERATFIASTESRGRSSTPLPPRWRSTTEMNRRTRLLTAAGAGELPSPTCAELVLAADQFVIEPATRTAETTRARAAGGGGAKRDRRLSLVHRLGPRHDDQPRRADDVHRPAWPRRAAC